MVTTPTMIDAARIPKNPPSHTAASRVARGAALLDERRPGWWLAVVPRRLDMQMGSVVASERISSTHLRRESFDVDPNCAMVLWAADAIRQVADRWAQAAGAEGA